MLGVRNFSAAPHIRITERLFGLRVSCQNFCRLFSRTPTPRFSQARPSKLPKRPTFLQNPLFPLWPYNPLLGDPRLCAIECHILPVNLFTDPNPIHLISCTLHAPSPRPFRPIFCPAAVSDRAEAAAAKLSELDGRAEHRQPSSKLKAGISVTKAA